MIKKILSLFTVLVLCSGASYMDQEQKYFFASDALIEALQNNVADEQKRVDAATKYSELMNQQTGMVSIDNLFAVCRAAGFNTYRKEGFDSCKEFINALIELDEDALAGFCPGLDANGKNPNALKSITNQTRIGDFCSSTNIYAGEVVFKKGYNCTCMAYACNDGFEFKGGACNTIVADGQGFCLRSEHELTKSNDNIEKAIDFCKKDSEAKKCKYNTLVINRKLKKVFCNATKDEVDHARSVMFEHEEKQKANMKYYEVCGKDKSKTGIRKYCVEDFFNWTQTQTDQAIGFAQDYARIKNSHTVYCKKQHRESGNDDYIACATIDGSAFYEFKFDDIKESVDKDRRKTERSALCRLAGGDVGFFDASNDVCKNLNTAQCANLDKLAKKYGHEAKWDKNKCRFTDYGLETMSSEKFDKSLAKIDGLDNYAFFKIQVIGIRNNFVLEEEIKKYIKNNLSGYQEVRCDPGYRTIKKADGFLAKVVGNHDDIKRCYANNKPIDFVVDDLSELAGYERDSGESGAKCIANDGKFDGHYCRGLTKDECFELERLMLKELKSHGWAGDDDLVDWDERAGACELNASQFANNLNKTGKYTAIAGLTIAGVFTGGTTTAVAVSLMSVELAGMAGEIVTERQKELLPQRWADRFLKASTVCQKPECAEKTLRENMGKISQASDMLNRDVLKQVDEELARLAELLPDDRLAEVLQNPKSPGCWATWECQQTIFTVMQMASLGAAVGKALVKLPQVLSKKFAAVAAKNATNGATHAGAVTNVVTKATDKADDVVDAVWDATAKRFRDPKTGRFVSGYTKWSDELAEIGVKESVVNGKKVYTDVKTGATLSETQVLNKIPTSMNDDFAKIGVRQIEQADGTVRYLDIRPGGGNKFISEAEVLKRIDDMPVVTGNIADNVADVTKAADKADDVIDASRAANNATDAARSASKADDIASISKKIRSDFDDVIKDIKNGKSKAMYVPKGSLTESEWKVLQESLRKEGLEMMDVPGNAASYGMEQVIIAKRGAQIDGLIFGGAKAADKADDVVDATRAASKTVNKADDVVKMSAQSAESKTLAQLKKDIAGNNFDDFAKAAKQGKTTPAFPASSTTDEGWALINKSLAGENIQLVDDGNGFKIFMRANSNSVSNIANKADDVVDAARAANNTGKLFDVSAASKNFSGYVGRHKVFLEKLPTTSGGSSEVVNISGRAVVVVNIDGHRLPYYVSSGQAGKDALGIPSGKWYPVAGIGQKNGDWGWFNKMKDMNHNPVSAMDDIEKRLNQYFDAATLKNLALNSNDIPEASLDASRIINSEFPKGVVPYLDVVPGQQGVGHMPEQFRPLADENFQRVIDIFR